MTELTKACGGGSSFGAAAAVEGVSVNLTNDTLIEAMLMFHCEGEEACVSLPQYGRGDMIIIKKLVETCKQSKGGLLALDNYDTEMVDKELLKMKTLNLYGNKIVDVAPLAALVNLTKLDEDAMAIFTQLAATKKLASLDEGLFPLEEKSSSE